MTQEQIRHIRNQRGSMTGLLLGIVQEYELPVELRKYVRNAMLRYLLEYPVGDVIDHRIMEVLKAVPPDEVLDMIEDLSKRMCNPDDVSLDFDPTMN